MGGFGSGSHWGGWAKETVENCLTLDANRWSREGLFRPGARAGGWQWTYHGGRTCSIAYTLHVEPDGYGEVRLGYTVTPPGGEPERLEYLEYGVELDATRPEFG